MVRNIVVYHDLDKLTGSMIHVFPLLTMWNVHWNIRGTPEAQQWGFVDFTDFGFELDNVLYLFKYYLIGYFLWAIPYYTILYFSWSRILRKDYYCLLIDELFRGQFVHKFCKKYGAKVGIIAFMTKHIIFTNIFNTIMLSAFYSKYVCTGFLFLFIYILFNRGGEYYINIFSRKYEDNLRLLDQLGMKYDPLKMRPDTKVSFD